MGRIKKWGEFSYSGIYIIYLSDIHFYIGQTRNFRKRWNKHLQALKNKSHKSRWMSNVYGKYKMFEPRILERCLNDDAELNEREQYWLDLYWGTYGCVNSNKTATGKGRILSQEKKDHLRNINLGKKYSDETKKKISMAGLGRRHSDESRKKMSEFSLQRAKDKNYLLKLSKAAAGKTALSKEDANKIKKISKLCCTENTLGSIRQSTSDGEEIAVWNNVNDIQVALKCRRSSLLRAITKKRKYFMSFRWDLLGPKKTVF